ncbi:MAG: TraR/DksA C4-type zinc finger protein [Myxococcota bacterium]|nr:TraR/DksA C4-type zinc finger protein [Myxococcota bacterium]MEC8379103.1 TraR/DksA C4-type zinc finger protein [Myxococcota bacterium]
MREDSLSPEQCRQVEAAIDKQLEELKLLLNLKDAEIVELDQGRVGRISRIDAIQHQQLAKSRENQAIVRLEKLERVKHRLMDSPDFFGFCDECGEPIPLGRLLIKPEAMRCVPCLPR